MISCSKKTLSLLLFAFGSTSTSIALAQTAFVQVDATPYDRQMLRVEPTIAAPIGYSMEELSFTLVNEWMIELRAMPYRYSKQWQTPSEVDAARAADCKGKALALYDRMQLNGATNLRLVIGKRRANDSLTHAWLEWETEFGTLLLDPTFNWTAAIKARDARSYIPLYGYEGARKYQAANLLFAGRSVTNRNPAAPAHGVITGPVRVASRLRSSPLLLDEGPIAPSFFSYRPGF